MNSNTNKIPASAVKERVSVTEAVGRYHHHGRRPGRTSCPFHGGENDNLGYNKDVFHCFVCGARGDVIDFVKRIRHTDFSGALKLLDGDFGLGLGEMSEADRRAADARQAERDREAAMERARIARNRKAFVLFCRAIRWMRTRPQTAVRDAQMAFLDRQSDFILDGGDYTSDAKAAVRAAVQLVREAEKNAG